MAQVTRFDDLQSRIAQIGLEHHGKTILANARRNAAHITKTIRDVAPDPRPALVISAGPSLHRAGILARLSGFRGCIVASDGAYVQCLKAGIRPNWVVTIDPHPTRVIRWLGDIHFKENAHDNSYFQRQDLDVAFRNVTDSANEENIRQVDANKVPIVIAASAPANVVERTAAFDRYWFVPLVDKPVVGSLTRSLAAATGCPALNTGGTVGTTAWVFADTILRSSNIAIVGADYSYYADLPIDQTQEWDIVKDEPNVEELFPFVESPYGVCRASVTYSWYAKNFLDLLATNNAIITNCSEHGMLHGAGVRHMSIEKWLEEVK